MSELAKLGPSVSLGEVAAEENLTGTVVVRVLRAIARRGLARPVAEFLLEEERRLNNERVRKKESRKAGT